MTRRRPNDAPGLFTDDQRAFIVTQFALGYGPTQIAAMVLDRYGIEAPKQSVNRYNPNSSDGRDMAEKWRRLYAEVREKMLDDLATIPIADRNYRLRQLEQFFLEARDKGENGKAAVFLEQAAKEVGGIHTNERKVTHAGRVAIEEVSDEEKVAYLADKLREQWERTHGGSGSARKDH